MLPMKRIIDNISQSNVTFATIDGLTLAEAVEVEVPGSKDAESVDTGFLRGENIWFLHGV